MLGRISATPTGWASRTTSYPTAKLPGMTLADDLRQTAVAAVEHAIAPLLWDVHPARRERVAEAAVRAAQPFLDGTEHERVKAADAGGTVPS